MSRQFDKTLIIGGSGYIGSCLSSFIRSKTQAVSTYFSHKVKISSVEALHLDVRDYMSVKKTVESYRPHMIYLLAYSLDDIEGTIVKGARHIMEEAKTFDSKVIFLSSDVVFGGQSPKYFENDVPDYINEYGHAKYKAEQIVLNNGGFVVRTSLVYGFQPMDIRTSQLVEDLQKGATRTAYFSDEFRCPIFINDLCYMLAELANIKPPKILHMTGPGCMSRMDFACKIASAFNFSLQHVKTALSTDSGLKRPQYLCLDSSLVQKILNYRIRSVDEILSEYISGGSIQGR